ncbi:PstS family phosphate ABC transporter substrate-binding protein [Olivibacter sp. XZL3]|uniref:PstS family phosphate ABC transporter substrate-binding protein n=1 Tax=Olivibacter sp. XZL3 TaxID=1735116 RepID=UPI0010651356|nr:substrate-binding domain-containing protein [Olivibacter sp. XZL3]
MKNIRVIVYIVCASTWTVFLGACNNAPTKDTQGILTGRAKVLVDETVAPIIEDQIDVFESSYTNAELTMMAKPENEVFSALLRDSAQLAITTRELTEKETEFFKSKTIYPRTVRFATDAIAVITNKSNPDSTISVDEIIQIMKGQPVAKVKAVVFDNANSSTVTYFRKLAGVDKLPDRGVYALKGNGEILKYVNENPQSIGILGINWIMQPQSALVSYVENIKVLGVKNQKGKPGDDGYYKPTQSNLALNLYPFTRSLYSINVQGKEAVGMGFSSFLHGERGQRLILKSGLLPDSIPPREIIVRN